MRGMQRASMITRRDAIKGLTGAGVTLATLMMKPAIGAVPTFFTRTTTSACMPSAMIATSS